MSTSCVYRGVVTHLRVRPRRHALRQGIFQLMLDLDEAPELARRSRLFGFDSPALLSFRQADHGDGSGQPLKAQIEAKVAAAGFDTGGPVRVLCMPRVLGHVFNPLTIYFCHRSDGSLSALVHEVNSTFGERHSYVLPATSSAPVTQQCAKRMHVSPFLDMGLTYNFRIDEADDRLTVGIHVSNGEGLWMTAGFVGERRPFADAELLRAWAAHPLLSLQVLAGIHWHALRLLLKGARYRSRPRTGAVVSTTTISAA